MVLDIRKRQLGAVIRCLHFNEAIKEDIGTSEVFKVLVIDDFTLKVVATLLHTEALRQHGVTLVLAIDKDREAITDAPVVYFVRATSDNARAIIRDLESGLYKEAHVNFASWAPRELLETLAGGMVKAATTMSISSVFDQYLNFIALESTLFTLALHSSYVHLNDNHATEAQIAAAVTSVVEGLFSVCVTLSVVPIIRCAQGGLAEAVSRGLSAKIAGHLKGRGSTLFTPPGHTFVASPARPLLCLFDRNFDLIPMVEQPFTYKALVQDCLGLKFNKVEIGQGGAEAGAGAGKKLSIEIGEDDVFWQQNGHQEFGLVAAEIDVQLKKYQEVMTSLSKRPPTEGAADDATEADIVQEATKALMTTVKSLPELRAQKKKLDNHMNLLYGLLSAIKTRTLDQFHELGQRVLSGSDGFPAVLTKLQSTAGTASDKLRLAILSLLVVDALPSTADVEAMQAALSAAGADGDALQYVLRMKQMNLTGAGAAGGRAASSSASAAAWSLAGLDGSLVSGIAGQFGKQLTKLVGGTRQAQMVTAVSQLMEGSSGKTTTAPTAADTFLVIDPKKEAGKGGEHNSASAREAIVFVIGGGNYLERDRLAQWGQACTPKRNVLYGATEMLSGEEFCSQLALLGKKSSAAP